jgi:hypothetical protein
VTVRTIQITERHARRPSTPSVDESSESEDAYRQRVYGTLEKHELGTITNGDEKRPSQQRLLKRFSKRLSKEIRRRRTSIIEALPDTPAGWTVLVSAVSSLCLGYELNLQKSLTMPPIVYSQLSTPQMKNIYAHLTATPESILRRVIQPSLFVGTRSVVASTAAYLFGGTSKTKLYYLSGGCYHASRWGRDCSRLGTTTQ